MPKAKSPRGRKTKPDFEQSLEQLEAIVDDLESGDLSLEQALKSFENGVNLTRVCQQALSDAEQTIKLLTEKDGETALLDTAADSFDD